jgi:uncharacterized membrane protein
VHLRAGVRVNSEQESTVTTKHLPGSAGHYRALAKAVSWRVIGTIDTFVWSLLITHEPVSAGSIASTEVLTKIILYYGHERLWRILPLGADSHLRSFAKAVSWRFVGSLDTFLLSLIFTGKLKYAVSIATAEALTKIVLYYLHERGWRLVSWGRLDPKPVAATEALAPVGS